MKQHTQIVSSYGVMLYNVVECPKDKIVSVLTCCGMRRLKGY